MKNMSDKMFSLRPLSNGSVSMLVMERIKEGLINGELHPGDKLPTEAEFCKGMGIGKSSVREGLKMLTVLGIVEARHGNGNYISKHVPVDSINPLVYQMLLDQGNDKDITELREIFEPAYTRLAMKKATDDDIDKIKQAHMDFVEKIVNKTQTADDDLAFHAAILNATHNPYVTRIGMTILQLFHGSIRKSMIEIPETAAQDHEKILNAFISGQEESLNNAVLSSFNGWKSMLVSDFKKANK
jgi:GntR family transcriptional repressor for pyruvate dehydrogenase complex